MSYMNHMYFLGWLHTSLQESFSKHIVWCTCYCIKVFRLQEKNQNQTAIPTEEMNTTAFIETKDGS